MAVPWPDSMVSSKHGSSPKVSNAHAEGSNANGLRPQASAGPSVRERKVSLQAAWSPSHSPVDRKVSPSSTPVKQIVSALEARSVSPIKDNRMSQAQSPEAATSSEALPEPATGLLFAPSTSENPDRAESDQAAASVHTSTTKIPTINTEQPSNEPSAAAGSTNMSAEADSKTPDVRKPEDAMDGSSATAKADTSVLSSQLTEPESKDPPLAIDEATTQPSTASPSKNLPEQPAAPPANTDDKSESKNEETTPAQPQNPLDQIEARVASLPVAEQTRISEALAQVKTYPEHLPLSRPWCFYWSDTSAASNSKSKSSSVKSYTSGMVDLFETDNVPLLCGAMKAIKLRGRPQKGDLPLGGYGLHTTGQNLHVFRKGVAPVWEDPWSAKGGRFQITPPPGMVEQVFERLVLSILGGLIDRDCGEEGGAILGIVGSKRNRGDRCEIWVGGQNQKIAPTDAWLESVRSRVGQEVEVNVAKYKSHFG